MGSILAVDHPVVLPDDLSELPVWDRDPIAVPAVVHRLTFPGPMVVMGAHDGLVSMLCAVADLAQPVYVVPAGDDAAARIEAACALNELTVRQGIPAEPVSLVVGDLPEVVARERPGLLNAVDVPPDYAQVTPGWFVPAERLEQARAALADAQGQRSAAPAWLNSGTAAALRLLQTERERELVLQTRARRAYDQMRDARDQMAALRARKRS